MSKSYLFFLKWQQKEFVQKRSYLPWKNASNEPVIKLRSLLVEIIAKMDAAVENSSSIFFKSLSCSLRDRLKDCKQIEKISQDLTLYLQFFSWEGSEDSLNASERHFLLSWMRFLSGNVSQNVLLISLNLFQSQMLMLLKLDPVLSVELIRGIMALPNDYLKNWLLKTLSTYFWKNICDDAGCIKSFCFKVISDLASQTKIDLKTDINELNFNDTVSVTFFLIDYLVLSANFAFHF